MEYLLETLLGWEVTKPYSAMGSWGVNDCFGHVLVVAHVTEYWGCGLGLCCFKCCVGEESGGEWISYGG